MGLCISKKSRYLYEESKEKKEENVKINRLYSEYENEEDKNYSDIVFSSSSSESDFFSSTSSSSSGSNSSIESDKDIRKHWNKCSDRKQKPYRYEVC